MHTRPVKIVALIAAVGMALTLFSAGAEAAKKKKKHHHHRSSYSHSYRSFGHRSTPAEYNACRYNQFRYPELDIRC